jgi:hypothetical protein
MPHRVQDTGSWGYYGADLARFPANLNLLQGSVHPDKDPLLARLSDVRQERRNGFWRQRGFLPLAERRLAAKYLSCMQFICPHDAFPFILLADASLVKIGLGTDKLRTANKAAAGMAIIHFIFVSS